MTNQSLRDLAIKVSQYFLDFLESDFKRAQAPRRKIILQDDRGFRTGMRVSSYVSLERALWKILCSPVGDDEGLRLTPGLYHREISNTLKLIIKGQIDVLTETMVETVRHAVLVFAANSRGGALENPEDWVDGVRMKLAEQIGSEIVRPLLALLDGPLSQQAYSAADSIYDAENSLIELVASRLDEILPEALSRYLATSDIEPLKEARHRDCGRHQ